jgi:hypothetical protein
MIALVVAGSAAAQFTYATICDFPQDGSEPLTGVTFAGGNMYGTCSGGGHYGHGSVWRKLASGAYTTLYSFGATQTDGQYPLSQVAFDAAGDMWGTCAEGGANGIAHGGDGTVWEITAAGAYRTFKSFGAAPADGIGPGGVVSIGARGLFGTCKTGGTNGDGTVWEITAGGAYGTLHSFGAAGGDGKFPIDGTILDPAGDLIGTCYSGGANAGAIGGNGTVWEIPAGAAYRTLHSFGAIPADGQSPEGGVTLDAAGDVWGTCSIEGLPLSGTVWEIAASGNYRTFYSFGQSAIEGRYPAAAAALDANGDLFATCAYGGANGVGTAWEFTSGQALVTLHTFGATAGDGANPWGAVSRDSHGDVFGTCESGGANGASGGGDGTLWGIGGGLYKTLHSFGATATDGRSPIGGIESDARGDVFGTCAYGGANHTVPYGDGTVWEFTLAGVYKTLYSFGASGTDGWSPTGGVVLDINSDLFGTCAYGGAGGIVGTGTVWKIAANGVYKTLHSFGVTAGDGQYPAGSVALDANGDLFGICGEGGAHADGMVWEITAGGAYKMLYSFGAAATDGTEPVGGVALDAHGDLFGICYSGGAFGYGTVWEIPSGGTYVTLHAFGANGFDGRNPDGGPTVDAKGNVFGTCSTVGALGGGTIWELTKT